MKYRKYYKDEYICKYGEVGNEFYILMSGSANVIIPVETSSPSSYLIPRFDHFLNPLSGDKWQIGSESSRSKSKIIVTNR